jgi:hypothetical protein
VCVCVCVCVCVGECVCVGVSSVFEGQSGESGGACCLVSWRCFGAVGSLTRWSG